MPMKVHVANHPLIAHKLTVLRDERTDSPTFRRLVEELELLVPGDEVGGPAAGQLAEDERQQDLHDEVDDRPQADVRVAGGVHQRDREQGGQEDPQQVGRGGAHDRPGDVAPRDGGEVDGALHRRGAQGDVDEAWDECGRDHLGGEPGDQQAHQGKHDEGARQDHQVEPPVCQPGQRFARV